MVDIDFSALSDEDLKIVMESASSELYSRRVITGSLREAEDNANRYLRARDKYETNELGEPIHPPAWLPPTAAHDAYPVGYIVSHNGKNWQNIHFANSWEPGTTNSQWRDMSEPEPGGILAWGPGQSVRIGAARTHNGRVWEALVDHVTHIGWEPSAATHAVWFDLGTIEDYENVKNPPVEEPEPPVEEPPVDPISAAPWGEGVEYLEGDVVSYDNGYWRCDSDHTSSAPPSHSDEQWVYLGIIDENAPQEPEEPPVEEPPAPVVSEWSAEESYKVGDKVTHNGSIWECLIAHGAEYMGAWAPGIAHTVWKNIGTS